MIHMTIKGYAIAEEARVEIGESGPYERVLASLRWYAENSQRVLVTVIINDEGDE